MNIFEMYYENGKCADFWVVRDSWKNIVARVVSIAGRASGPLTGLGRFPYFNGAKEAVYAEVFEVIDAAESGLIFKQVLPKFDACPESPKLSIISCPGTFAYRKLDFSGKPIRILRLGEVEPKSLSEPAAPDFLNKRLEGALNIDVSLAKALEGKHGNVRVSYDLAREAFIISFPYSERLVSYIKSAPAALRKYNSDKREWMLDVTCLEVVRDLIGN